MTSLSSDLSMRVLPAWQQKMWALVFLLSVVNGQDCLILQPSDLGDTSAPSSVGLLAETLAAEFGTGPPSIQILEINPVCLAQGTMRDRYRSISIVVRYLRAADNMEVEVQVEYDCNNASGQWRFNPTVAVTVNPEVTLATAVRTNCILCGNSRQVTTVELNENHCAGN